VVQGVCSWHVLSFESWYVVGPLTIGRLAEEVGVSIETVRYYERRQLIEAPPRSEAGYRHYGPDDVARLRFIRRAKDLGFTLTEIRELVTAGKHDSIEEVVGAAKSRLTKLDEEVRVLISQRCRLRQLLEVCDHGSEAACIALLTPTEREGFSDRSQRIGVQQ
jgi:MerR family transcriptional regulator, copper efflux regulator